MLRAALVTVVAGLLLIVGPSRSTGEPVQWKVADGGNGHYYELIRDGVLRNWIDAKPAAEALTYLGIPGHMVTITSAAENQFIIDNIYDGNSFWMGLTDDPVYGGTESSTFPNPKTQGWVWVTGEPFVFNNWNGAEPNNQSGDEHYVIVGIGPTLEWNDLSRGNHLDGVFVEFSAVPEPSSLALGLASLAALMAVASRRRFARQPAEIARP